MPDRPFRPTSLEGEVREELDFHVEERARELMGQGWGEAEAWREARRRFGDVERIRRESGRLRRSARTREQGRGMMRAMGQDVVLAVREVTRQRGLSALVVVTLALGIGFATALFSVVDGVLLRPLPYGEPDRLVYVWQNDRATGTEREPMGTADYFDFRDRTRSFEGVGLWGTYRASLLREGAEPLQINAAVVNADVGRVLGIEPALGRGIGPEEAEGRAGEVVVLAHELWRDGFGARPDIVGERVDLDGVSTEVIGVLPPRATVAMGEAVHAWRPLDLTPATATRSPHAYTAVARLAGVASLEAAQREAADLARTMEAEDAENLNRGALVEPVDQYLRGDARGVLAGLLAAVGILLALTVLNVGNLLLARARARARDTAVHTALGAGGLRMVRRSMVATTLLALAAAGLGGLVAWATLRAMLGLIPSPCWRSASRR
jgi:predicted permease